MYPTYNLSRHEDAETGCQWSSISYRLQDINDNFQLPVVVRVDYPLRSLSKNEYPVSFLRQPMLLYEKHTINKYVVRHYKISHGSNEAKLSDEALILPQTYTGWFVHLQQTTDGTVSFHDSIEDVSRSKAKVFISKFGISGCNKISKSEDGWQYRQQTYSPGSIFQVDKVYTCRVRVEEGFKFLSWKKRFNEIRYLKCIDSYSRTVLFPITTKGTFFEILPVRLGENNAKMVLTTSELFTLPQAISPVLLVYGSKPFFIGFSGIIKLERKLVDESMVGSIDVSLTGKRRHRLIELSVDSNITYQIALNGSDVIKRDPLGTALKLCRAKANVFSCTIHVPFSVPLELPESIDLPECIDLDAKASANKGYSQNSPALDVRQSTVTDHILPFFAFDKLLYGNINRESRHASSNVDAYSTNKRSLVTPKRTESAIRNSEVDNDITIEPIIKTLQRSNCHKTTNI